METLFEELKRYVAWGPTDEAALRDLHRAATPELARIAAVFYDRILGHAEARKVLESGERKVGQLKVTLQEWMDSLLAGPWDEAYYERRARIGRYHVHIGLPQHYMFGAMNVIRLELVQVVERAFGDLPDRERSVRAALAKMLDMELAIMLHTYREDLISQKARSERLATFGQLVASIGHELRNPLGVIESSLYILRGRVDDDRGKKHVERIGEQLLIANRIISDLLDMIRDRPLDVGPVQPAALVATACSAVKTPPDVRIVIDGVDGLPPIRADASKLRHVLVNLIENSVHAVGTSGEIRITAEVGGEHLVLAIEDTGPGVAAEIRKRLFEPLITTKAAGIGLGLALVRRIVERHGGTATYEPFAGQGARFVIRLRLDGPHA